MATPTSDYSAAVALLVGIDKSAYDRARTKLKQLSNEKVELKIDDSTLDDFKEGIKKAISAADRGTNQVLGERMDRTLAELATKYGDLRKSIVEDGTKSDVEKRDLLKTQDDLLTASIEAETKAHKLRLEAADKLKEATTPNVKKFKEASEELGKGFMDALGKAKSGDMSGLADSLTGALSGAASKKAGALDLAAQSAGSAEEAAALGAAAAEMAIVASALAVVGGALAAIVALFIAADDQAKEFNTTLLEGAGVADFMFKRVGSVGGQMENTLVAAQEAAFEMAGEWRGQAKDYLEMTAALNQAGLTFKEMVRGAQSLEEQKSAIEGYMTTTMKWSKTFGLSTSEMAEDIARLTNEQGMSNEAIIEQYSEISKWSQMSGMGTKRFFTAVSQATAGMALYNARMDEAAGLLLITSKVLGDTDASDFIKSLTKGFVDESYQDRYKRMLINGVEDTKKGFIASLGAAVETFADDFQDSPAVRKAFSSVLGKATGEIKINTAEEVKATLAGMSQEQTDQLKVALEKASYAGDDTAKAALEQLMTLTKLQAAATGDKDAMVKGFGALSMSAKLAAKMDNFMGKRLGEMSATELMAYEQTSGISGEQLEQLMRVEDMMHLSYKESLHGAKETHSGFLAFVASNEEAKKIAKENGGNILTNDEQALAFAKGVMENTHSIFDVLKNEISSTLLSFYKFAIKGDPAEVEREKQSELTQTELEKTKEALGKVGDQITAGKKERDALISGGASDADVQKKRDELAALGVTKSLLGGRQASLEKRQKDISMGADYESMGAIDYATKGSKSMRADQDLSAWGMLNNIDPTKLREAYEAQTQAGIDARFKVAQDQPWYGSSTVLKDQDTAAEAAGLEALKPYMEQTEGLTDDQLEQVSATAETLDESLTLAEREKKARERWEKLKYGEKTTTAMIEALRKVEAEKLAGQMGFTDKKDFDAAVADLLDKGDVTSDALKKVVKDSDTFDKDVAGFGNNLPATASDFVMRPGQKAQRFSSADTLIGMKEGGPLAAMGGGGGSQHITINVNGGDPAQVYQTVKSALKNTGART